MPLAVSEEREPDRLPFYFCLLPPQRLCPLSPWERVRVREPIIPQRYRIVGSNSAAYSDVRGLDVMARLHRARRECFALDKVSPALRAWASDFSLRGQRKVTKRKATPLIRPTDVGYLRLTLLSNGTRRWAVHGPTPLARRPASRSRQEDSPQRIRGGSTPCQPSATV